MTELLKASAKTMARSVREREVGPVELIDAHIARAEAIDGELNALVLPRFEQAREEAQAAEKAVQAGGQLGPLHGVPFTAKECIEVAGMPCCDACKIFEGNVSTQDAVVIESLRDAGAILLGKTNIPEFALHYDSNNLVYGATSNPHDHSRSAGGSSGGEAAALATGLTAFGVGSDYGGSIRVPSHFCGVVGLKPGRHVVPGAGHFPPAQPLSVQLWSVIGPLARYVEDLELLLPIFARPDPARDPDVPARSFDPAGTKGLHVALFEEDGLAPIDEVCREAARLAGRALADGGHEVVEERPPNQAEVRELFEGLALAETAAALAPLVMPRESDLSPQIRHAFERLPEVDTSLATYVGKLIYRAELERATSAWLEDHPIAVCPVGCTPAFPIGTEILELQGQEVDEIDLFSLCSYGNALGLPAAVVPVTRSADGLPVGVQVMGRRDHESEVLAVTRQLEQAFGGWMDPEATPAGVTESA